MPVIALQPGVPTTYTQDLVAPLPVVLQAKTGATATQYLFSMGTRPIAQYTSGAWQYLFDTYIKLLFLRSRYYSPETARFLSKDSWQGDYTRPESLDAWAYVEGNPVNRIDPSGLDWQQPTGPEGTRIHQMIYDDFFSWGRSNGFIVAANVRVAGASKKGTGNYGLPDLLDLSNLEVYEIKHLPSGQQAIAEAIWYRDHLNVDPRFQVLFRSWQLGILYLVDLPYGKPIGDWPNDPVHLVWAGLYAPGAVVY